MARFFTDFGEFAAGSGPPAGWTPRFNAGDIWSVVADAGATGGRVLQSVISANVREGLAKDSFDATIVEVVRRAKVSAITTTAVDTFHQGAFVRGSGGSAAATNTYVAVLRGISGTGNTFLIVKYVAGTFTPLTSIDYDWSANTYYWIRLRAEGSTLSAKVWSGSAADEPGSWTLTITDTSIEGSGWCGVFDFFATTYTTDRVGIGTAGDSAPTTGFHGQLAATLEGGSATLTGTHPAPIEGHLATHPAGASAAWVGDHIPLITGALAGALGAATPAIAGTVTRVGVWTSTVAGGLAALDGFVAPTGPLAAALSGASGQLHAFHDWAGGLNPALLQTIYTLTLTDPAGLLPELILPMSSFQATAQAEGLASFLSCVVPAALLYAEAITERLNGALVVSKGFRFADGSEQTEEILRIPLGEIRLDEGPNRASATLSGYGVVAPGTPKTRALTGIRYRNQANGLRRVRADVDLFLRPGDTALDGSEAFTVSYISYYVGPEGQFMEAAERAL